GRGEVVDEHDRLARVVVGQTGVGHARFALDALPAHAGDRAVHRLAHLFVHRSDTGLFALVAPRHAHALSDLLDDPQVLLRVARGIERAPTHLDHAVGV